MTPLDSVPTRLLGYRDPAESVCRVGRRDAAGIMTTTPLDSVPSRLLGPRSPLKAYATRAGKKLSRYTAENV